MQRNMQIYNAVARGLGGVFCLFVVFSSCWGQKGPRSPNKSPYANSVKTEVQIMAQLELYLFSVDQCFATG